MKPSEQIKKRAEVMLEGKLLLHPLMGQAVHAECLAEAILEYLDKLDDARETERLWGPGFTSKVSIVDEGKNEAK